MPFCTKCGVQVNDNSKYCSNCGNPIGNPVDNQSTVFNPVSKEWENSKKEMVRLYNYFSEDFAKSKAVRELEESISSSQALQQDLEKQIRKNRKKPPQMIVGIAMSAGGFIYMIFGIALAILFLYLLRDADSAFSLSDYSLGECLPVFGLCVGPCIAMLIVGLILLCISPAKRRARLSKILELEQVLLVQQEMVKKWITQKNQLESEIKKHFEECPNCPIGIEYSEENAIKALASIIESHEAETITEAIQRYELHKHEKKLESYAHATYMKASEAADAAREAAKDASAAKASAEAVESRIRW